MKHRPSGALLVSIALHVVFGFALASILKMPYPFRNLFESSHDRDFPAERIGYVRMSDRGAPTSGRSGGDVLIPRLSPPRPLVAPPVTPVGVPEPARTAPPQPEAGAGPVIGRGGAAPGITPSFSDPRIWISPGPPTGAPKSNAQRLDSVLVAAIRRHQDSLAALVVTGREPGDWTVKRNGKKYGIDQRNIYIGDVTLPTAVLALLPLNIQGNPGVIERERALGYMRADIWYQAQRSLNEDEFREAVKRIRERKDRERRERQNPENPVASSPPSN